MSRGHHLHLGLGIDIHLLLQSMKDCYVVKSLSKDELD